MAWDALGSIFKKKDDQGTASVQDTYAPTGASSGAGASNNAPVAQPNAGFGGQGGSAGSPVSSKFVNFGTLYGLNQQKAENQAHGLYNNASAAGEKAQGDLQGARNTFNQQVQQGTAQGPIGGPHGTRIDNYNPTQPATTGTTTYSGAKKGAWNPTTGKWDTTLDEPYQNSGADRDALQGTGTRGLAPSGTPGATTAGVSRYSGLYGPSLGTPGEKVDQQALRDYHASTDLLGAKSGAGQGYTGPASLQGSMGDEAYAGLGNELRKAGEGANALTNAGGIENALGYGPGAGAGTGDSALDTGLTQVAGQQAFGQLAKKYGGLSTLLPQAQADSERAAAGAGIQSADSAKQWQDMLDQYNAANAPKPAADKAPASGQQFGAYDGDGNYTNAGKILNDTGYTMSELQDIEGDLTPQERAYLYKTSSDGQPFGALYDWVSGSQQGDAALGESIKQKLANHRSKKQGGQ